MEQRTKLAKINGVRDTFTGTFVRFGTKRGWQGVEEDTVLLRNIKNKSGKIVTKHLWFNLTQGFEDLGEINEGDLIQFDARAKPYMKGYVNNRHSIDNSRVDYHLSHPTQIELL